MHTALIQRLVGLLLMLFSITLLPPIVIDILYQEDAGQAFFYSYLLLVALVTDDDHGRVSAKAVDQFEPVFDAALALVLT